MSMRRDSAIVTPVNKPDSGGAELDFLHVPLDSSTISLNLIKISKIDSHDTLDP